MSPIITHEDELELAKMEKELVSQFKKLAKAQSALIGSQKKYAENIAKMNNSRDILNRTFRDVLKQMQTLAREHRSNIKDEEVKLYKEIIQKNDDFIKGNNTYLNAIKDIAVQKEYLVQKKEEFVDALAEVADRRSNVIKKALDVEKAKNKLIDGDKLNILDQQLNDVQREFDRARDILLKKIYQFIEVRDEINALWIKLKDSITELN
ncbi:MAG: hypothetical protein KAT57_02105 [Candidatus Lokiarchaeota archaeon]|nr:hypothetical protein [Candidatus Lokiarchaeota archaeon]TKJ22466.1 MAG: hypothetical protein CEE43_06125 [Candidatus Lokiarchaeota archaeon Loki_b32]